MSPQKPEAKLEATALASTPVKTRRQTSCHTPRYSPRSCSKPIFVRFSRRAGIAASGIVGRVAGLRLRQSDGSWAHRASNQTGLTIRPCTPKRVRGVQSRWESFVPAVDCTRLRCRGLFSSRAREQPFEALTPLEGLQAARKAAGVLPRITFAPRAMPCGLASESSH